MLRINSIWLTFRTGLKNIELEEHSRLYSLFKTFGNTEVRYLQIIILIGKDIKSQSIKKLRFAIQSSEIQNGEVHLSIDLDTIKSKSLVLFVDYELHTPPKVAKSQYRGRSDDIIRYSLVWYHHTSLGLDMKSLSHFVYAKLVAPFNNIICFFVEDFGGPHIIAEIFIIWLVSFSSCSSDLPPTTNLKILVIICSNNSRFDEQTTTK
jgi:hypothetical protein